MKIKQTILALVIMIGAMGVMHAPVAMAAGCEKVATKYIPCDNSGNGPIWNILMVVLNFFSVGVGIVVVGAIVYGSILYTSAGGDQAQVKKGVSVITNAIIGLLAYIFMYAIINYLVPGGLFT